MVLIFSVKFKRLKKIIGPRLSVVDVQQYLFAFLGFLTTAMPSQCTTLLE